MANFCINVMAHNIIKRFRYFRKMANFMCGAKCLSYRFPNLEHHQLGNAKMSKAKLKWPEILAYPSINCSVFKLYDKYFSKRMLNGMRMCLVHKNLIHTEVSIQILLGLPIQITRR